MKISTDFIRDIVPGARILCNPQMFDYVDIVDYSTKPKVDPQGNILWCVTRSESADDLGWYGVKFNREQRIAQQVELQPRMVLLTDSEITVYDSCNVQQIVVPDVKHALELIYRAVLTMQNPKVIGVTGSVGKTTCVCMIEELFSRHAKVLRLYSKRITPLNLFEMIINSLEGHEYVATEYAMYHKHHVGELVRLLPPNASAILNIESAHLGVDGLETKMDIWNGKRALIEAAQYSFVEREVMKLILPSGVFGFRHFSWRETRRALKGNEPFIRSELQYAQMGAALGIFRSLRGRESDEDIQTLCDFVPKEKRLMKVGGTKFGKAFFDGEVTNASRMKALSSTFYPQKTLIIQGLEFFEQDLEFQKAEFAEALQRFDRVFVYREAADRYSELLVGASNITEFSADSEIAPVGEVFIHWGAYWRQFGGLDDFYYLFA